MSFYTKGGDGGQQLTAERDPPHSIEAEQALLGAVLLHNTALGRVTGLVEPHHFFEPLHIRLFEYMQRLSSEGRPVTPITLSPLVKDETPVGELTVGQYLGRLLAAATTVINAEAYAKVIREAAQRREMIVLGERMVDASFGQKEPVVDVGSLAVESLTRIVAAPKDGRKTQLIIGDAATALMNRIRAGEKPDTVPTGLMDIDRVLTGGGLAPGQFIIGAGRPGMGKSTVGPQLSLNMARAGYAVSYQSLEMGNDSLAARCLSSLLYNENNPIEYTDIAGLNIAAHDLHRLEEAERQLKDIPLFLDEQGGLTAAEIAARTRILAAQCSRKGTRLRGLIVDHMGLVKPGSHYAGQKVNELDEISQLFMALAKELGIFVLALYQLSRKTEMRDNKRPELQDLRDSGAIEQNADIVFLFYREAYYNEIPKDDDAEELARLEKLRECWHVLEARIAKQRGGITKNVRLFASMGSCAVRNLMNKPSAAMSDRYMARLAQRTRGQRPEENHHAA